MRDVEWIRLMNVYVRSKAEMLKSYLNSHGIEVWLVQESYEHFGYRFQYGDVDALVLNHQLEEAHALYQRSNWNFDATDVDKDEEEE